MLTQTEEKEISEEFAHYEQKSAACIDALRIVQRHRGWVSDEAVFSIARFLQMTPAEVDGVATFYNLIFRKPVGRHVLFVCDSASCWVMGCERMVGYLKGRLGISFGETTSDGTFTMIPIACLGSCENAPVIMVDHETVKHVTEGVLDELLARFKKADEERRTL